MIKLDAASFAGLIGNKKHDTLTNGFKRTTITLKWGRTVVLTTDQTGKLVDFIGNNTEILIAKDNPKVIKIVEPN